MQRSEPYKEAVSRVLVLDGLRNATDATSAEATPLWVPATENTLADDLQPECADRVARILPCSDRALNNVLITY
jgi:hypothetical protein